MSGIVVLFDWTHSCGARVHHVILFSFEVPCLCFLFLRYLFFYFMYLWRHVQPFLVYLWCHVPHKNFTGCTKVLFSPKKVTSVAECGNIFSPRVIYWTESVIHKIFFGMKKFKVLQGLSTVSVHKKFMD